MSIDKRHITSKMIELSNNSILTNKTAISIIEKLDQAELVQFYRWLQLAEQDKMIKVNQAKRKLF